MKHLWSRCVCLRIDISTYRTTSRVINFPSQYSQCNHSILFRFETRATSRFTIHRKDRVIPWKSVSTNYQVLESALFDPQPRKSRQIQNTKSRSRARSWLRFKPLNREDPFSQRLGSLRPLFSLHSWMIMADRIVTGQWLVRRRGERRYSLSCSHVHRKTTSHRPDARNFLSNHGHRFPCLCSPTEMGDLRTAF